MSIQAGYPKKNISEGEECLKHMDNAGRAV